jgi:hypothetical protein
MRPFLLLAATVTLAACDRAQTVKVAVRTPADSIRDDSVARARQDSINRAQPGYVIDSLLPVEEEIRRFREAIGGAPVTALANGSASRDALVRRLVTAVSKHDSVDVRAMTLTAREFADLIYPSSPNTRPPYRQPPGLVWMQISNPSNGGRLMNRLGGVHFRYVDHTCNPAPEIQGENKLWTGCQLRVVGPDNDTTTQRWFGAILERGGTFKFLTLANQF